MVKVLILDNYDSFTFNLVHYVEACGVGCTVVRNDELDLKDLNAFDKVIISPGPGLPADSGALMDVLDHCIGTKPLLGICLGLQGIVEHFGGSLFRMQDVAHGVALRCTVLDRTELIFDEVPDDFEAGMYHSWAVDMQDFPNDLIVTAQADNGVIMGARHKELDVRGLQFHPESIMTPHGKLMIENWLDS